MITDLGDIIDWCAIVHFDFIRLHARLWKYRYEDSSTATLITVGIVPRRLRKMYLVLKRAL